MFGFLTRPFNSPDHSAYSPRNEPRHVALREARAEVKAPHPALAHGKANHVGGAIAVVVTRIGGFVLTRQGAAGKALVPRLSLVRTVEAA